MVSRSPVTLREATVCDVDFLAELWADALRKAEPHEHAADLEQIIKTASASPEQRLVIAEYDGKPAGATLLRVMTITPLNLELAVQIISPHVAPACRRHGVGRTLMESAVAFADEVGVPHVVTGVSAASRDANRFMARLALGPLATVRTAPVAAVRARLVAQRPDLSATGSGRQLTRVLAARRSMRRSQAPSS